MNASNVRGQISALNRFLHLMLGLEKKSDTTVNTFYIDVICETLPGKIK